MNDREESKSFKEVLEHLRTLKRETPTTDAMWSYLDAAEKTVFELLGMILP